jgi:hypothetical protein
VGFFAGSVDLTSPSPIGSTTPNTGAFTTLSATPPANTTAFTSTGFSLTGTNAQTLLNLAGTWNTTGTPTAILANITDTASNASSLLFDLQTNSSSRIRVTKNGGIILPFSSDTTPTTGLSTSIIGAYNGNGQIIFTNSSNRILAIGNYSGNNGVLVNSSHFLGFASNTSISGGNFVPDAVFFRDAAGIMAQRNSTNAQTFRLYNTYTDASNYERGFFRWSSNVLEIGAEAAGTGTQRQLRLPLGTVTASTPLSVTQTWNSAGVTFTGIQANITDTASASGSLLMDLQV